MKRCKKPPRRHINTTIDSSLYKRLIPVIEKDWGGPFSSWLDYIATCYMQEGCAGCPYEEKKGQKRVSLGKISDEEV